MTASVKKQGMIDRMRARPAGWVCAPVLLLCTSHPSLAQGRSTARPVIRLEQIVAVLTASEMPLESAEVKLTAQIVATIAEPMLELKGVEPWGVAGARVRIACVEHEQCLPFYVAIHWADAAIARIALSSGGTRNPEYGSTGVHRVHEASSSSDRPTQKSDRVAAPPVQPRIGAAAAKVEEPSVHLGTHATLLIDGQKLHIKLPVICLEKGVPGRMIRVTALDHKQTYLAEVVDSTLLKGSL